MRALVLILCLFIHSISNAQNKSQYGVDLIDEPEFYQSQLNDNPDFEMIDLKKVEGLRFDIRYATANNFTGEMVYEQAEAFLRKPAVLALSAAIAEFKEMGYVIKVFDAYRPYDATVKFYELVKDTQYVASPYSGSRHNRGCAIDITLIDISSGEELKMPTDYDDFTERAHPDYSGLDVETLTNRTLLIEVMLKHGFKVYPYEWWHFDFIGWEDYPLMNLSFEQLKQLQ